MESRRMGVAFRANARALARMGTPIQFGLASCLCAVLLTFTGCATTRHAERHGDRIWNDDPTLRIDFPAAESRLRLGLQSGQVGWLVVLQIDRHVSLSGQALMTLGVLAWFRTLG